MLAPLDRQPISPAAATKRHSSKSGEAGRRIAPMLPSGTRPILVCSQSLERKSVAKVFKHEFLELLRHHHSGVADGKRGLL